MPASRFGDRWREDRAGAGKWLSPRKKKPGSPVEVGRRPGARKAENWMPGRSQAELLFQAHLAQEFEVDGGITADFESG